MIQFPAFTNPTDFRVIHDTDKSADAHNLRGSLSELYPTLQEYNAKGYGVFYNFNVMNDSPRKTLADVNHIRAHVVDLDNTLTSDAMLQKILSTHPAPHFVVNTSPNKYHVYWLVQPYTGNDYFNTIQRKLAQLYDGDKKICDPTRVLRVPGFNHMKSTPHSITYYQFSNADPYPVTVLADSVAHVNVVNHSSIARQPLGSPDLAAPSLDWLKYAMTLMNPNDMDRDEWMSFSAAIKQSGWSLTDEETLYKMWLDWCDQYDGNDEGENRKLWDSLRDTEVGWKSIERRTSVGAYINFGFNDPAQLMSIAKPTVTTQTGGEVSPQPQEVAIDDRAHEFGELLSPEECKIWFKDCYFVTRIGEIFSPTGRFMNATKFNGTYGGKHFIISQVTSKTTDEPWKAALRSTCYTIPKVDHIRFLPHEKSFDIIYDDFGRAGLNTYIPAKISMREGDVSLWLKHVENILPVESDRKIFYDYLAHCVKYPGVKLQWAPLLQSAEGVGKTVFYEVMRKAIGQMYIYRPKAQELVSSGSKFNAWMRAKLMIMVDEIKVDERRELLEVLKPMITDADIEVQSKGVDQEMEDNMANWVFFSNFKDAVPISENGRRFATFFSVLQSERDILEAGMDKKYFDRLWTWLRKEGGLEAVAYWLHHYPIEKGDIAVRAPKTSSHKEAIMIGRTPIEVIIEDCINENLYGFRGGYISVPMLHKYVRDAGIKTPSENTIRTILNSKGYQELGYVPEPVFMENADRLFKVYGADPNMLPEGYLNAQA